MVTASAISQKILEALRDSPEILAGCEDLFDKAHSVFLGFTGEQAPHKQHFPCFQIYPAVKVDGEAQDNLSFTVGLEVSLEDTHKVEATTAAGVYTAVYRGSQSLEELMDLAVAAIREISPQLFIDEEQSLYDPLEFYPLFVGVFTLTINVPKTAGGFDPQL
jgi:hypothetical protein